MTAGGWSGRGWRSAAVILAGLMAAAGHLTGVGLPGTEFETGRSGPAAGRGALDLAPSDRVVAADALPFRLPFDTPPGPSTWYVSQSYGNTVFAYNERRGLYRSGQGIHMGLDLATPCGTQVRAIGDGVVHSVDGPGGSPPHNLMIRHPNGYVSFYGHLLERPSVAEEQQVAAGDIVALSGDMLGTCHSSPHLHLEIRDASLARLVNPVTLIEADWHRILLLGSTGPVFERDLEQPGRWQSIDDQPSITIGGALINDYGHAWPPAR